MIALEPLTFTLPLAPEPLLRMRLVPYSPSISLWNDYAAMREYLISVGERVESHEAGYGVAWWIATEGRHEMAIGVFDGKLSTLVHEIFHTVVKVFDYIEAPINLSTDECAAYLADHIFEECSKALAAAPLPVDKRIL